MSDVKWIKLSTQMFEDEKIRLIESMLEADELLVIWFKLYFQGSKDNSMKITNFSRNKHSLPELLSILFKRKLDSITAALEIFKELEMIEIRENEIKINRIWLSNKKLRTVPEYKEWRTAVFKRDGFECQCCRQIGNKLNAHHIKPFASHPSLRFEISNGITLCESCHKEVHTREREIENG